MEGMRKRLARSLGSIGRHLSAKLPLASVFSAPPEVTRASGVYPSATVPSAFLGVDGASCAIRTGLRLFFKTMVLVAINKGRRVMFSIT